MGSLILLVITIFAQCRFPMSVLPMIISQLVQAKVAMDRLTNFFLLDELQTDAISRAHTEGNYSFLLSSTLPLHTFIQNQFFSVMSGCTSRVETYPHKTTM